MISTYYGFWDYWELRHKVTFDGVNRLILINVGETDIDIQRDVYSAWKEWVLQEQNSKFLQALTTVGGEPTIAGQFLDATYFLINGWRIKPYPGSYTLNLEGNIFEVDGNPIFVPSDVIEGEPNNININTNTSVIVRRITVGDTSSGGGLLPDERTALFNTEGQTHVIETQIDEVSSKLTTLDGKIDAISGDLFIINDRLINIESVLLQPIQAELVGADKDALAEIQAMVKDLWKIHGLDPVNPMTVSKTARDAGTIQQTIEQIGESVKLTRV